MKCHDKKSSRLIGIIAPFKPHVEKPVGKQTNLLKEFISAAQLFSLSAAIFSPESLVSISAENGKASGYTLAGSEWKKVRLPIPDVIYDRYYSDICGFDEVVENMKRALSRSIPFINPVQLTETVTDKLRFYEFMTEKSVLSPRIIADSIPGTEAEWKNVLNQKDGLIVKPRFGLMGRGVIRIHILPARIYQLHLAMKILRVNSTAELNGAIDYFVESMGLSRNDFIVQEEIRIPGNRYFDIRCLIQRNGTGLMEFTGMVVRCATRHAATPNIDQGGFAMDPEAWFQSALPGPNPSELIEHLRKSAETAYSAIETTTGNIGELGLDLLIDNNYNVYLLEANAKPGRFAFQRLSTGYGFEDGLKRRYAAIRARSIENPVLYGRFLANTERKDK